MRFLKLCGMYLKYSSKVISLTTRYKTTNSNENCFKLCETIPLKLTFPYQHWCRGYSFHSFKGDDTDSDTEDMEYKRDIKNIILPYYDDILTTQISESKSLQDIFDLIQHNNDQLNWKNISMAIAMVRELQIIYYRVCMYEKYLESSNVISEDCFKNILTNNDFLNLLNLIENHYEFMDIQCLSYSILCLHKIGVDINCVVNQKLTMRLKKILMSTPVEEIQSCILSRFIVSIVSRRDLAGLLILKDILPIVIKKIDLCESFEDIKHISICLYNLPWFLNKCIMDHFANKAENMLLNRPQHEDKVKCIVKVLKLLNSPFYNFQNNLIRSLLLELQGSFQQMALYDMIQIQMIIMKQSEPYQLFEEIISVTSKWLSKADVDSDVTVLRLLSCIVHPSSVTRRKHIEELLKKQFLLNNNFSHLFGPLFNIIRNLKTSDEYICNSYWSSLLDLLNSGKPSLREHHKLLRICNRYMNFNNNLAGTYRHYKFENQMIKWLNEELDQGVSALIPSKFSKIFSFFLSYPNDQIGYEIPEQMVKKVTDNIGQYTVYDCFIVSRGLNSAFIHRKNKTSLPIFLDQYVRLCTALNRRCLEILNQEPDLSMNQLNSMFRGYNHRFNVNEPELFYKILDRYKNYTAEDFSSRIIRELTNNLAISDWYDSELLGKCLEYYTKYHKYLLAENIEKILSLFFLYGVNSEQFMNFLPHASEIINRDKYDMSGLNFMRASLALCYFYNLPSSITDYLFSVEFLEKLEDELNNCYAKGSYPSKVRQILMILNRAVCIDYPELDVPWFHTKYCEEIQSLVSKQTTSFYLDVERKLNQLIKNKSYLKTNSFSPYGYKLDFEINLMKSEQFNNRIKYEKIALLLLNEKDLRKTDNEMRGHSRLKQRHLEILGYRVIWIKKSIWNSMFMTEPEAKLSYLKSLIWHKP